jgi:dienelactone hydrolase
VVPGHVREGQSGIEQLANEPESYQHAAAARLARAGFVTLTFELRGFGYTGRPFGTEHVIVAYNAFLQDHSYKALVIQDTQAAVAILRSMDRVDKDKIGIAGASYGGEIAVNYAALDESIKVIISHSAFGYTGRKGMKKGGTRNQPHYCHLLPNVDSIVRREYWYWMLAPRPVLGIRGDQDAPHFADVFDIYNQGWEGQEGLELKVQSGGHEFFVQCVMFRRHMVLDTNCLIDKSLTLLKRQIP